MWKSDQPRIYFPSFIVFSSLAPFFNILELSSSMGGHSPGCWAKFCLDQFAKEIPSCVARIRRGREWMKHTHLGQ
ncbi:hypothetical protein BDQ94DRAFT_140763 [Aspergillus welwitschiae]|uniref:Uncharacterized protein n=1 Tax=Aspergillus welwitschiae TaxID=1341132 RepID=A0A3F3Q6B0_9EURO|nr:hypothetical protein BDQ94DRAFT_140763 [Aspergillus welwitschiae]RDH34703.1 hypothetical protein BDQ94DRAFT_140763 [Aspergillus welwitschiae]